MDHTRGGLSAQAEDLLRQLSAASNAVRLYPVSSPLRIEAIARFTRDARAITAAHGPMQYHIDRGRFILGETAIGEGLPQIAALAETLHALQVGQLIIAPSTREDEVARFLDVLGGDAVAVRASGGIRKALLDAGVENIAVVEVTLRASSEEGLLGLDLTTAPTEEIARELTGAVTAWAQGEAAGDARDTINESINRLEPAARDLAMRRCAEALLLLDEASRLEMLNAALPNGANEMPQMEGMLDIIARMPPAALARLLRLSAARRGEAPDSLLGQLELSPEIMAELSALLRPAPQSESERGVPPEADVKGIVTEVTEPGDEDILQLNALVRGTTPREAAARGLATSIQVARLKPADDSVRALADAVKQAARNGAIDELGVAATFIQSLSGDPRLGTAVQAARAALTEPALLEAAAARLPDDPANAAARTILQLAGTAGAEALVAAYVETGERQRTDMLPAMSAMIDTVAPVAGRVLRSGDAAAASTMLRMLGAMGSRRLSSTIAAGLEHLDSRVREEALIALAASPGPESRQFLQKALSHWDPETRRVAAREIGRAGDEESVPALLKIIAEVNLFERNYELKKEVLKSLETLHSARAVPVLKRIANRGLVIGKKNRELRYLARRVLESLERG